MNRFASLTVAVALAVQSCRPPSPSPPAPDASDAAPPSADAAPAPHPDAAPQPPLADRLCASLRLSGCKEGFAPNCAATVQHALDTQLTTVNAECLLGQSTKAGVRFCGSFVACP